MPALRIRHQIKDGDHYYIFFNEGAAPIETAITMAPSGHWEWIDLATGLSEPGGEPLRIAVPPHDIRLARVSVAG